MVTELEMKILGIADLANRWVYTRQGVWRVTRKKDFPIATRINNGKTAVYSLQDIEEYENDKPWLFDKELKDDRKTHFYATRHKSEPEQD